MKTFFWKDKTGHGLSGTVSLDAILNSEEEDKVGSGNETLCEWAQSCEEGDEWESSTDKYVCTSVDDSVITCTQNPLFFPDSVPAQWNDIEVHPVKELGGGVCEVCEEADASFYSVYLHKIPNGNDGGVQCIADLPTKELAHSLADLIEKAAKNYKP